MCHNITCFKMIDFISAKLPHCCGYLLMIQVCTVASDWKYFLLLLDWLTHSIKPAGTHLYTYLENCFKCQTFFYTDPGQGFDSSELLKVLFTDLQLLPYVSGSIWLVCVHGTILIALGKISIHLHYCNVIKSALHIFADFLFSAYCTLNIDLIYYICVSLLTKP